MLSEHFKCLKTSTFRWDLDSGLGSNYTLVASRSLEEENLLVILRDLQSRKWILLSCVFAFEVNTRCFACKRDWKSVRFENAQLSWMNSCIPDAPDYICVARITLLQLRRGQESRMRADNGARQT